MSYVHERTGISKAQISLIENGKADPRMSTVVRILSCLDASLTDLEPRAPEVITIDEVVERAEEGAKTLKKVGLLEKRDWGCYGYLNQQGHVLALRC
jgi:predicted transcriptional regulator